MKKILFTIMFFCAMQQIAVAEILPSTNDKNDQESFKLDRDAIIKQLEVSKLNKDIIKTNCLMDKLNQINSLIKMKKSSNIEYLKDRSLQIKNESFKCIGVNNNFQPDITKVFIEVNLPQEDFNENLTSNNDYLTLPTCASCIK
jgi:hypothetical protein